jgi:hypothetical protein
MTYFHLLFLLLLGLNFSGKPAPIRTEAATETKATVHPVNENEEVIPWAFNRRLSWDDFLCEPQKNSDAVASTSTSLGIAYQVENDQLTYSISCNFSKNKSWGLLKTNYILAHEQGHFDITEICARKLFRALQEYQFNRKTYREDINDIYQRIVAEKEYMQATYDGETDHSRNRKVQYEWLQKIDQMLDETAPWAEYP